MTDDELESFRLWGGLLLLAKQHPGGSASWAVNEIERLRANGAERYWEGRWRDEAAEVERLRAELKDAVTAERERLVREGVFTHDGRIMLVQSEEDAAKAVAAENERLQAALERIEQWSRAYPLSVFPEPDLSRAAEVLKANGMTLDSISAYNMRHVVKGVGKIARDALQDEAKKMAPAGAKYEPPGPS